MTRSILTILRPLVLRPLTHEKGRTAVTILGIAVGVAVLVAIQLSNQSALRSFSESVDAAAGRANWQIWSDAGELDEEVLLRLQPLWDQGVQFAPVIDLDALLLPSETPIRILGVDLMADLQFRDYDYASVAREDSPEERSVAAFLSLFSDRSVVVSQSFAAQHGLALGSRVQVALRGAEAALRVQGILDSQGPARAFSGSVVVLDLAVAQEAFPQLRGRITRVDLLIPAHAETATLEWLATRLPPDARVERPSQRGARVDRMLRAFRVNLIALASVSLLVGLYLVYNTVLISILRRRREIGIIKTLGGTPRQIMTAFLLEGSLFGLIGGVLGVALGWVLARGTLGLIERTVNALYVQSAPSGIQLTPAVAAGGVLLGLLVSVLASLHPAIEASAVRPNSLIRPGLYQPVQGPLRIRLIVGALTCFAIAAALALAPAVQRVPLGGYASVLMVVAGFSLLAPGALHSLASLLTPPLVSLLGIAGRLATAGVVASLRRTAVATAALTIAIAMMVAVSMMVGSFRETVQIWVGQTLQSDLWLRPARGLDNAPAATFPATIAADLDELPLVAAYDRVRTREIIWQGVPISLGSADFDVARDHGNLPMTRGSSAEALDAALRVDGVLVSESLAIHHGLRRGDTIGIPAPGRLHRAEITGVYRDYSSDRGVIFMDRQLYTKLWNDDSINTVAIFLREGVEPEVARRQLEQLLGPKHRLFVATNALIRSEVMRIFDQTFLITWSLLVISLIVAVMGIVNTLSALIIERRPEISLLRILGALPSQIRTMILSEAGIIGLVASILGVVAGAILSLILIFVINRQSFGWTIAFHPPWSIIVASLLITFAATVLSGLIPARMAMRQSVNAK